MAVSMMLNQLLPSLRLQRRSTRFARRSTPSMTASTAGRSCRPAGRGRAARQDRRAAARSTSRRGRTGRATSPRPRSPPSSARSADNIQLCNECLAVEVAAHLDTNLSNALPCCSRARGPGQLHPSCHTTRHTLVGSGYHGLICWRTRHASVAAAQVLARASAGVRVGEAAPGPAAGGHREGAGHAARGGVGDGRGPGAPGCPGRRNHREGERGRSPATWRQLTALLCTASPFIPCPCKSEKDCSATATRMRRGVCHDNGL